MGQRERDDEELCPFTSHTAQSGTLLANVMAEKYHYRGNDVKQKMTAGNLTPFDIVQLSDGTVGFVLSHDEQARAVWVSAHNELVPVSHDDLIVRLLNITDFVCEMTRDPSLLRYVTPSLERFHAVR